jgi:uncharacterized repeat protein (TIGR01451 family)
LTNVTLSGNSAGENGGGIYRFEFYSPSASIRNSVLWGNRAGLAGDQMYIDDPFSDGLPTITHSDIEASGGSGAGWDQSLGLDGGGNLDSDPQFVEPVDPVTAPTALGDLHLRWGSPAINSGDNTLILPELTTDLDGASRIVFGRVDMGPYEVAGFGLFKSANDALVTSGQRITYTIRAFNATDIVMTGGLISDTLPPELELAGPVSLNPSEAGVVGSAPPILVSDLIIDPGKLVTVTLPVMVQESLEIGTAITNSASLTSAQLSEPRSGSCTVAIPFRVRLPLVAKQKQVEPGD